MILGLGIDVLSLARIQAVVERRGAARVAKRICCARELGEFERLTGRPDRDGSGEVETLEDGLRRRQLRFLSSRWAAKEAAYKALSPLRTISFKDLDLRYTRKGAPTLALLRYPALKWSSSRAPAASSRISDEEGSGSLSDSHSSSMGLGLEAHSSASTASSTTATVSETVVPMAAPAFATTVETTNYAAQPEDDPNVSMLVTISHDEGILVAAVVAQRAGR